MSPTARSGLVSEISLASGSSVTPTIDYLPLLDQAPLAPASVPPTDMEIPGSSVISSDPTTTLSIVVTFQIPNQTELSEFLTALSDPSSPLYHHYLTAAQFDARFSPSAAMYQSAVQYLQSFGVTNLTTLPDRLSLSFEASSSVAGQVFHTNILEFTKDGTNYYAPSGSPELPAPLASSIEQVGGLGTYLQHLIRTNLGKTPIATQRLPTGSARTSIAAAGYLTPPNVSGVQYEYASDFQVAYDEQSLFSQYGFPMNATVATILWAGAYLGPTGPTACGSLTEGQAVGPFVPSDIYDFYNETLPTGQPHAQLTAVPIDGAALPGKTASCDSTGVNVEDTLDLEMVGSTAPGARIYNVYGPSSADLDDAFAEILSPSPSLPLSVQFGLLNVTVISNSWGGPDGNDSSWFTSLEQAQARGITVLASSGDSGDNPLSSKYVGSTVEFPSSMAYNAFGDVAVGGTTVTLDTSTLQLTNQTAWNISAQDVADSGPAGSTGGISAVFPEPSWQKNTEAQTVIGGGGRGVPDIAAVANNTLITITLNGYQFKATNATNGGPNLTLWGTSIASPLVAGLVATIDHSLVSTDNPVLGFLDPTLYQVANAMYAPQPAENPVGVGAFPNPGYTASLPTLPFYDVTSGSNYLYPALPAYDLVTGWGSLDAYNYTMYVLSLPSTPVVGHLSAVRDWFNLTGLKVTSTFAGGGVNTNFNASIQQNFFLANSLGAPVYWVQNVVYISGQPGAWDMMFTGWVIFPFYGLYPSLTVYEYNLPTTSLEPALPLSADFTTQLVNPNGLQAQVDFSFGVAGAAPLTLPVPGASFIIGMLNYTYSWQGVNYTNGPYAGSGAVGGLAPQFGLVGGPSLGIGNFLSPTGGNLSAWIEPVGISEFLPAGTETFGLSADQTGEEASNLTYVHSGGNEWKLQYLDGSSTQGVLSYEGPEYPVQFQETTLPAGTSWSVTVDGTTHSSTGGTISFSLPNGTYSFTVTSSDKRWSPSYTPSFAVAGVPKEIPITFVLVTYSVAFQESGLPSGLTWSVTFNGALLSLTTDGGTDALSFPVEPNGTYPYLIADNAGWHQSTIPYSGTQAVNGIALTVILAYTPMVYSVTFTEQGLGSGLAWSVTFNAVKESLTTNGGTDSLSFASQPNSTYPYSIAPLPGWIESAIPYSGTEAVNGAALAVTLTYSQVVYRVTFTELGLPSGIKWYVNVTGQPSLSNVTSSTGGMSVAISLPNGTYSYVIGTADKEYSSVGGSLPVNGAPAAGRVTFTEVTYDVSFTEAGLPLGTNWSIALNGSVLSATTSTLTFVEPNGTYLFTVEAVTGYTASASSGSVKVTGTAVTTPITFSTTTSSSTSNTFLGLPLLDWYLLVGVFALVVILGVILVTRRGRRKPTESPPPSTPPAQTGGPGGAPPPGAS